MCVYILNLFFNLEQHFLKPYSKGYYNFMSQQRFWPHMGFENANLNYKFPKKNAIIFQTYVILELFVLQSLL